MAIFVPVAPTPDKDPWMQPVIDETYRAFIPPDSSAQANDPMEYPGWNPYTDRGNAIDGTYQAYQSYWANLYLQQQAQRYNSAEAVAAREFERYMADTRYQRSVHDLKASGLNPWLALSGSGVSAASASGNAASSGAGSASPGSSAIASSIISGASVGIAAVLAAIIKGVLTKGK